MMKTALFPCYLSLCSVMLQRGWSIVLSFLQSRAVFDADFYAHTMIREGPAEVLFLHLVVLALLAAVYIKTW